MKKHIVIGLLIFLTGCGTGGVVEELAPSVVEGQKIKLPDPSRADPQGRLVFALGGDVSILNPILSSDTASSAVEGAIFSGLMRANEKLEMIPDLTRSFNISSDGRVWTFHLKKGIFWHDGKPFTAEDVKFTYDAILDPKTNSVRRSDYIIDGVPVKFKALDSYTLQATLPKPFAPFLVNMGMSILPRHLYAGTDINRNPHNRKPVGTGPFIFKEWKTADHVTVARNPRFYRGAPRLAEIIFRVIPDENSRLVALESGEIDETNIPPKDYHRMKRVPGINVFEYDALTYTYFGFNLGKSSFQDRRVRQALAYATDKKKLVDLIFKGLATPAYSPSAPISWAYSDKVNKYPYNPEKAKALLSDAGYLKPLEFTLLLNQGNKEREKAAVILQEQWKKIGVKINIRVMEWSSLLKIINAPRDPKDFDAIIIGWSLGIDPDDYSIWHSSQYPRGLNFIKYQNPRIDTLLEQGRTTMERAARKEIYAETNRIIAEDQPYIFLWYPKAVAGVRKRVGGLSKPGPAGLFLNLEKVFVTKKNNG